MRKRRRVISFGHREEEMRQGGGEEQRATLGGGGRGNGRRIRMRDGETVQGGGRSNGRIGEGGGVVSEVRIQEDWRGGGDRVSFFRRVYLVGA